MIRIEGLEILERLASGASGHVHRAVQKDLGRTVAVKILDTGLFEVAETRGRFLREAKVQARLSHPNLVALYDAGFAGEVPYLVMELVTGGSLRERLQRERLVSIPEALGVAADLAGALECAHAQGIVHRDLKPENVLFSSDGMVKLADFGLAKMTGGGQSLLTGQGVAVGTPGYLAPEALKGAPCGPAADIYGLGVVLFEMLAGCRPFTGTTAMEVFSAQLQADPPSLSRLRPEVPPAVAQTVAACLDRDPEERLGPAGEVHRRLAALANGPLGLQAGLERRAIVPALGRVTKGAGQDRQGRRSYCPRLALVLALATTLAVAVVIGLGWRPGRGPPAQLAPDRLAIGKTPAAGRLAGAVPVGSGPPSGTAAGRSAQGATATSGAAVLPSVVRITVGPTEGRVWLGGAIPAGARSSWWPAGTSSRTDQVLARGARDVRLRGLTPGTSYEGELAAPGAAKQTLLFQTLPIVNGDGRVSLLQPGGTALSELALARHDERVAVLWNDGEEQLAYRESPDGGLTWGDVEDLGAPGTRTAWLNLAMTERSAAASWVTTWPELARGARLMVRPVGAAAWRPVSLLGELPADQVALGPRADGALELIRCPLSIGRSPGHHEAGWGTLAGEAAPVLAPAFENPDGHEWCRMIRAPRSAHALTLGRSASRRAQLFWSSCAQPGQAPWSPLAPLTSETENLGTVSAAVLGERLVVAYEADSHIWVRLLEPGARAPCERFSPIQAFLRPASPQLVASGGTLFLGYLRISVTRDCYDLYVLSSADARTWRVRMKRELPLVHLKDMRVVGSSDRFFVVWNDTAGRLAFTTVAPGK